ncbi:hypothetical protein CRYUN_Cryun05aG0143800 [Craigia yunnanensis]
MATPATIPMTSSQSTPGGGAQSQPPIATPAFRAFLSRLTSSIRQGLSQRRPWYELIDRTAMARPDNLTDAYSRIRKNLSYFKVNYITLLAVVLVLSLLSPLSSPLPFCPPRPPRSLGLPIPLPTVGSTSGDLRPVGSLLISAILIGVAIICIHGAFRVPEDLFLDDQEPANSEFLSFLGGAASSAAAAAAPAVASRV